VLRRGLQEDAVDVRVPPPGPVVQLGLAGRPELLLLALDGDLDLEVVHLHPRLPMGRRVVDGGLVDLVTLPRWTGWHPLRGRPRCLALAQRLRLAEGRHARVGEPVDLDRGAGAERASVEGGLARVLGGQAVVLEVADVLVDGLAGEARLVCDGGRVLALVEPLEDALLGVGRLGDRAHRTTSRGDVNQGLTLASTSSTAEGCSRGRGRVDMVFTGGLTRLSRRPEART